MRADRTELETRWLALTREALPAVAQSRGWPVRFDHCFQRILLDVACGGCWYDSIRQRPAYRHAPVEVLASAVALGEQVLAGTADLHDLNRHSLAYRLRRSDGGR